MNETTKATPQKTKPIENPRPQLESYFFAGGTEYEPITIEATSIEEATEKWEKIKKPVNNKL